MSSPLAGAPRPTAEVGIGLRQPHYAALLDAEATSRAAPGEPAAWPDFVEVHSENFFADGGAELAVLHRARERHPVSLHGVGLALGSAAGVDAWHLDRLARLVERVDPVRVSDHASYARVARAGGSIVHANDLLPIAHTDAALAILCENVAIVQDRLRRQLLVENVSAYVSFADAVAAGDARAEPEFFAELCRRTGCGMLLDVNNVMVNAVNAGAVDPVAMCRAYVDAVPAQAVGEIHVAGYCDAPGGVAIDDHGSRVRPDVWAICAYALERLGPRPVLVEWDTALPALPVLLEEAALAARLVHRARGLGHPAWGLGHPAAGATPPGLPSDGVASSSR